ncbi:hypothetical protein [Sphingobacterium pedocola]|uniref:hypothetical protein n=1 Tax=Sphingobacterium pedocola TaxID=2082722 RepID=UPI0018CBE37A|nr:hypothetical protein [Sphingobacterium pedocola]
MDRARPAGRLLYDYLINKGIYERTKHYFKVPTAATASKRRQLQHRPIADQLPPHRGQASARG